MSKTSYSAVILKPSSKIQSMIRMYLTRKKYFAKRKGLGLEQPKLYRYSGDRIDNKSGNVKRVVRKKVKVTVAENERSPQLVRGIRGFLLKRNRKVRRAVIAIQAAWRGWSTRKHVFSQMYSHFKMKGVFDEEPFLRSNKSNNCSPSNKSSASKSPKKSPERSSPQNDPLWVLSPDSPIVDFPVTNGKEIFSNNNTVKLLTICTNLIEINYRNYGQFYECVY